MGACCLDGRWVLPLWASVALVYVFLYCSRWEGMSEGERKGWRSKSDRQYVRTYVDCGGAFSVPLLGTSCFCVVMSLGRCLWVGIAISRPQVMVLNNFQSNWGEWMVSPHVCHCSIVAIFLHHHVTYTLVDNILTVPELLLFFLYCFFFLINKKNKSSCWRFTDIRDAERRACGLICRSFCMSWGYTF